jgi:hypothetical protein
LLNRHLQERSCASSGNNTNLLPLLVARDAQALVTFCVTKCVDDLIAMQQQNDHAVAGCLALRSLLVHFLRHVVHLAAINDDQQQQQLDASGANPPAMMREWWMQQLFMDNQHGAAADEHGIAATIRAETNQFFRQLETLGQETLESVLDVLVDSSNSTNNVSLETILSYSTAALELTHVLENDFELHGSFDTTKQSLLVSLTEIIVVQLANTIRHDNPGMVPAALELLVSLAKQVLATGTTASHDKSVQNAVTMILYLSLNNSHGSMTEDLESLWVAITSNSVSPQQQSKDSDSLPLSLLLTTLLLPTSAGNNWKESAARLIVSTAGEQQQAASCSSPWHHIVSRKIAPSGSGGGADGILQAYARKYALPPPVATHHQQAADATTVAAPRN